MEGKITVTDILEAYKAKGHHITQEIIEGRVVSNAIEIAMNNLEAMQDAHICPREVLTAQYISDWAKEFEMHWLNLPDEDEDGNEPDYFEEIDKFSAKKLEQFKN